MAPRGGSWLCSFLVHSNSLCLMGSTGFPQRCRVRIMVRFRVGVGVKVRISVRAGVGFRIMVRIRVRMLDSSAGDLAVHLRRRGASKERWFLSPNHFLLMLISIPPHPWLHKAVSNAGLSTDSLQGVVCDFPASFSSTFFPP